MRPRLTLPSPSTACTTNEYEPAASPLTACESAAEHAPKAGAAPAATTLQATLPRPDGSVTPRPQDCVEPGPNTAPSTGPGRSIAGPELSIVTVSGWLVPTLPAASVAVATTSMAPSAGVADAAHSVLTFVAGITAPPTWKESAVTPTLSLALAVSETVPRARAGSLLTDTVGAPTSSNVAVTSALLETLTLSTQPLRKRMSLVQSRPRHDRKANPVAGAGESTTVRGMHLNSQ